MQRGKCDPWTYFLHKMRCLIKPTSISVHRADGRMPRSEKLGIKAKLPLQGLAAEVGHGSEGQAGIPSGWCLLLPHGVRLRGRVSSTQAPFSVLSDVTHC